MLSYRMNIAGFDRDLPLCPLNDELFIGAFVIFGDPELTTACARELLKKAPEYNYMIAPEAKSIPLIAEMARLDGSRRYIIARKAPKLYMKDILKCEVKSITTEAVQTLYIDGNDAALMKGKRIIIVDDVISTGESARAVEELVKKAGGNVVGTMAVLAEGKAADRSDIIFLKKLPLFSKNGTPID